MNLQEFLKNLESVAFRHWDEDIKFETAYNNLVKDFKAKEAKREEALKLITSLNEFSFKPCIDVELDRLYGLLK